MLKISNFLHREMHLRLSTILKTSSKMVFGMVFLNVFFLFVFVSTAVMAGNDPWSHWKSHKIEKHL